MHFFTIKDEELCLQNVESLPEDLEALYQLVRKKYTIEYHLSDWADDDSDAGWGYCYDNSYSFSREPYRSEMIISNGELVGFYVGSVQSDLERKRILTLKQGAEVYINGTYSSRYGDSETWTLKIEENPAPSGYVYLRYFPHEDKNRHFTPADFSEVLVAAVVSQTFKENTRGRFDGASRFKLKLTPAAIQNPDHVLEYFEKYRPVMVRE